MALQIIAIPAVTPPLIHIGFRVTASCAPQVKIAVQNPGMLAVVVTIAKFPMDKTVSISWEERDNELE